MKIFMNHSHSVGETPCSVPELASDLKAYLDNELPLLRRRAVATHLRQCSACREEIAAMTNITDKIKTADAGPAALDPAMRQRLLQRLETEKPASSLVPTARRLPLWRRKPLLVFGGGAAYVGVFLVFLAILLPTFSQQREKARQSSTVSSEGYQIIHSEIAKGTGGFGEAPASRAVSAAAPTEPSAAGVQRSAPIELTRQESQDASNGYAGGRQVHREGSITVSVDKLEAASDKVEQAVKASGGFVASNNLNTDSSGYKSADLTVRVPEAQFDEMFKQFAALGNVTAKSISGEDITESLSDATQAEQVLKDAAEEAAQKLKVRSGSEKEIRYREADLRRVRIELAQTQARLGLLRKMARLSTIRISLTEKAKQAAQAPPSGFLGDMRETNRMASAAFASAVRVPVVMVIWVLAFSPLWLPLVLIYRYVSRRSTPETASVTSVSSIEV